MTDNETTHSGDEATNGDVGDDLGIIASRRYGRGVRPGAEATARNINDWDLRQPAGREEVIALRAEADKMNALANDPSLVRLAGSESNFYQEVRRGYLDAEKSLRDAADRIEEAS